MELTKKAPDLRYGPGEVFRSPWLPDLLASLVFFGMSGAAGFFLWQHAGDLPWFSWIALGPMVLLGFPLLLLLSTTLFGAFLSSLRATNWFARVTGDGVFLNLRDYRNGHFEGPDPTVVFFSFRELVSVGKVLEERTERDRDGHKSIRTRTIELVCADDAITEDLRIACALEQAREAPTSDGRSKRSRTKFHSAPVYVAGRGRVRVQWNRKLYEALARELREAPEEHVDLDSDWASLPAEERAQALLRRGQRMGAVRALREDGWSRKDARDWVETSHEQAA